MSMLNILISSYIVICTCIYIRIIFIINLIYNICKEDIFFLFFLNFSFLYFNLTTGFLCLVGLSLKTKV